MHCPEHPETPMQTVCGETRCPGCYESSMVGEYVPDRHPGKDRLVVVYDPSTHRNITVRETP